MERVIAYIDGYNLYFGLKDQGWKRYYWLNLQKLSERFLKPNQSLIETKYFTTVVKAPEKKRLRQQVFLDALRTLPNLHLFFGHFLYAEVECRQCKHTYVTHHEKMTDVNISVEMLKDAFQDRFDVAFLISADSDLVSPIQTVHNLFPKKKVVSVFPPERYSAALKQVSKGVLRIGRSDLAQCQFPEQVASGGVILQRPSSWC